MKRGIIALILACGAVVLYGENGPIDLILLLDTSSSMSASRNEVNNYIAGPFLKEFLRSGDTFHLLPFSGAAKVDFVRRIESRGDVEALIGRMFLQYPIDEWSDIPGALSFAENYAATLPSRPKKIVLISDGDTVLPPARSGAAPDAAAFSSLIRELKIRLGQREITFDYVRVVPGKPLANLPRSGRTLAARPAASKPTAKPVQTPPAAPAKPAPVPPAPVPPAAAKPPETVKPAKPPVAAQTKPPAASAAPPQTAGSTKPPAAPAKTAPVPSAAAKPPETVKPAKPPVAVQTTPPSVSAAPLQAAGSTKPPAASQTTPPETDKSVEPAVQAPAAQTEIQPPPPPVVQVSPPAPLPKPAETGTRSPEQGVFVLRAVAVIAAMLLLAAGLSVFLTAWRIRKNSGLAVVTVSRCSAGDEGFLNLFVADQNTFTGRRNIHALKSGWGLTVGGGKSDFLIFLTPMPPGIGEIRRTGGSYTFIPRKSRFFPDLGSKELPDCIGKTITALSDQDREVRFSLERYVKPFA